MLSIRALKFHKQVSEGSKPKTLQGKTLKIRISKKNEMDDQLKASNHHIKF